MLRPAPGRRAEDAAELRQRGAAPHDRLRRARHRDSWSPRRARARRRAAGERDRGRRLGRRSRNVPDPAEAAHDGVPARGRAPAAAHEHVRRGRRACATRSRRRSTASSTSAASSGSTRRSSRRRDCRGRRADVPRHRRSTSRTCRARPTGRSTSPRTSSAGATYLTVSGQLNVETYCLRAVEGLHVRPDVPRRELEHARGTSPSSG